MVVVEDALTCKKNSRTTSERHSYKKSRLAFWLTSVASEEVYLEKIRFTKHDDECRCITSASDVILTSTGDGTVAK